MSASGGSAKPPIARQHQERVAEEVGIGQPDLRRVGRRRHAGAADDLPGQAAQRVRARIGQPRKRDAREAEQRPVADREGATCPDQLKRRGRDATRQGPPGAAQKTPARRTSGSGHVDVPRHSALFVCAALSTTLAAACVSPRSQFCWWAGWPSLRRPAQPRTTCPRRPRAAPASEAAARRAPGAGPTAQRLPPAQAVPQAAASVAAPQVPAGHRHDAGRRLPRDLPLRGHQRPDDQLRPAGQARLHGHAPGLPGCAALVRLRRALGRADRPALRPRHRLHDVAPVRGRARLPLLGRSRAGVQVLRDHPGGVRCDGPAQSAGEGQRLRRPQLERVHVRGDAQPRFLHPAGRDARASCAGCVSRSTAASVCKREFRDVRPRNRKQPNLLSGLQ